MRLTVPLSAEHRRKISEGVKRTIALRRKRRTDAQIRADGPKLVWENTASGRWRTNGALSRKHGKATRFVRDLRREPATVEKDGRTVREEGLWILGVGWVRKDDIQRVFAENAKLHPPRRRIPEDLLPLDRPPWIGL